MLSRIIAIVGMGYVGLPLAETYLDQGFRVIGIDKDEQKLQLLQQGRSYIADVPDEKIQRYTDAQQLTVSSDFAKIASAEAVIICVPTPLTKKHVPDMTYLIDAFLVVVIGGLGQIKGAVIAAIALGILNSFIEYNTTASVAKVAVFVIIVIFLQIRPQGLFTVQSRSLV